MPAEYEILYADKRVEKQLRSLPQAVLRKLDRKLMRLKTNPRAREVVIYEIVHRRDLEKYLRQFLVL